MVEGVTACAEYSEVYEVLQSRDGRIERSDGTIEVDWPCIMDDVRDGE